MAIRPAIRSPAHRFGGHTAATSNIPSTAVASGANRTFPPYSRVLLITTSAVRRSSVATPECHVANVRRSRGRRRKNASGYAPGPISRFTRVDTCFAASASQPADAISRNRWSPAHPTSTFTFCPSRCASIAPRILRGIPVSRHQMFTVPPGSAATAESLPTSPAATSRTVPSPPSANTSGTPDLAAVLASRVTSSGERGTTNAVPVPRRSRYRAMRIGSRLRTPRAAGFTISNDRAMSPVTIRQ